LTKRSMNIKKHVPQRTCVACRQVKAKRELVRLVCVSDGSVEVDTSSKKTGRGDCFKGGSIGACFTDYSYPG